MGCTNSKDNESPFRKVEDSVHSRIKLEKRKQIQNGETPHAYKPRQPHPMLEREKPGMLLPHQ